MAAETHGREQVATLFHGRATTARPASVDGIPGLVVLIGGKLVAVFEFIVEDGVIAEILLTSDAGTIETLTLEY